MRDAGGLLVYARGFLRLPGMHLLMAPSLDDCTCGAVLDKDGNETRIIDPDCPFHKGA